MKEDLKSGWIAVCVCRIIMGLTQGLLMPSLHGMLGQWAPTSERSRMVTIVYAGTQLGTVIEMMTAGILSASKWGWPSVFYVTGIICLVWSLLWFIFGASTPSMSRWISKEERKYIEDNTASADISQSKKMATPWKSIWTSLPFLAIIVAACGQSLGYWTLLTEMPSYMAKVLGVDIKSNGLLSALPYFAKYLLSFVFSWSADFLINRKICSIATTRKIFNTIAFWGPGAALLALSYLPPGQLTLSVVFLTFTVGLNGAHYVGFLKMATPWKSIWTSLPFLAIIVAACGQSLGYWTLLTEMPSYMAKVLGVDIKSNGLLSALPYFAKYLLSFVVSSIPKLPNLVQWFSSLCETNKRAFWGPGAALLALSYLPPGQLTLSVVFLTFTVGLNGAHYVGFLITIIDISPNFASTLMGITNTFGTIFSILAPLSVSAVVRDETSTSEWQKVFFISVGFYFFANLFFILFMSGNVQPWNEPIINDESLEGGVQSKEEKSEKENSDLTAEKEKF